MTLFDVPDRGDLSPAERLRTDLRLFPEATAVIVSSEDLRAVLDLLDDVVECRRRAVPVPLPNVAVARRHDLETSHAAALSVGDLRPLQAVIVDVLSRYSDGLTDEDLVSRYLYVWHDFDPVRFPRQSPSGIRTRRSELARGGLVEPAGETRQTSTGRQAKVWRVVRASS